MGLPSINIEFYRKATSFMARSERGTVLLLLRDTTKTTVVNVYSSVEDVVKADWTAENFRVIDLCFMGKPNKVIVVRAVSKVSGIDVDECKQLIENLKFDWFAAPCLSKEEGALFASYFNSQKKEKYKKGKAVLFDQAADSPAVINFATTNISIVYKGEVVTIKSEDYTARIAGLLAGVSLTESATFKVLREIVDIKQPKKPDDDVNAGKLIIIFDGEKFKIARAVTSLVTVSEEMPEDFKKIKIVEASDMVRSDIKSTYEDQYVGKRNNTYDNKQIFVGAVHSYLTELGGQVIDEDEDIEVAIDTAWIKKYLDDKKKDTSEMSEIELNKSNTGSHLAIKAKFRFLDAMEDLVMGIEM
jgi:phage tail sheath protein